jgi:hypothetical protein
MTPTAILLGSGLFCGAFLLHVSWWRLKRPKDDVRALVVCLLLVPALAAILLLFAGTIPGLTIREALASILVTIAVSSTYIMYYPAAQAASPSMLVIMKIASARKTGITRRDLLQAFDEDRLCRVGIDNLVHQRFAQEREGRLVVAPRGAVLLRVLTSWRRILGLKHGIG